MVEFELPPNRYVVGEGAKNQIEFYFLKYDVVMPKCFSCCYNESLLRIMSLVSSFLLSHY